LFVSSDYCLPAVGDPDAESTEKHGVWDPMPELTIAPSPLCPLQSRLQHIYHGQPYARVDLNPMPESTLSPQSGTLDSASDGPLVFVLHGVSPSIYVP
jgi:hypothetical protein